MLIGSLFIMLVIIVAEVKISIITEVMIVIE